MLVGGSLGYYLLKQSNGIKKNTLLVQNCNSNPEINPHYPAPFALQDLITRSRDKHLEVATIPRAIS